MSYGYDTKWIQFKATNINASEGTANQGISGDWTGCLLGTHAQKLRHGEFSTGKGQRLYPLDLLAPASGTQKDVSASNAAALILLPKAPGHR